MNQRQIAWHDSPLNPAVSDLRSTGRNSQRRSSLIGALSEVGYAPEPTRPPSSPAVVHAPVAPVSVAPVSAAPPQAFSETELSRLAGRLAGSGAGRMPRWVTAARRTRWRERLAQAGAWIATLFVVGAIVGLAWYFLAPIPTAFFPS
jgi:hypothetical protein